MHAIDVIRRKRDGAVLAADEINFVVKGAAQRLIPDEQLAAWLMAIFLRGLDRTELNALTQAMRYSGEVLRPLPSQIRVDKHSSGGVGDKTSFLVTPIAAAAGLTVPMISGRALGHTGGTLDKLETIPGFRAQLSSREVDEVLAKIGACMAGQSQDLVPADRVLYAVRDRTGSVESPYLLCSSIMSKKLAEGLDGLVLDVKTGSGAFLKQTADALYLAELMVETGNAAGTRTTALLTSMDQPLGRRAGNWIEIWESLDLLRNHRDPLSEDLRELSLILAGWMIFLGGKAASAEAGRTRAEDLLTSGAALELFVRMVEAQGGDVRVLQHPANFHAPAAKTILTADRDGYITKMDCEQVGWAVQRLGAGPDRAGETIDPHAGLELHAKIGSEVKRGDPLCTLFAAEAWRLTEPTEVLRKAITLGDNPPSPVPLVLRVVGGDAGAAMLERRCSPGLRPGTETHD